MHNWERPAPRPPPDPHRLPNPYTFQGQPQVRPPLPYSLQYVPIDPQVAGPTLLHLNRQSAHLPPKRSYGIPANGHVVHQGQAPLKRSLPNTQQRPAPTASGGSCTCDTHLMSHVKDAVDRFSELSQWLQQRFNALRDQGDENHTTLLEGRDDIKNLLSHVKDAADRQWLHLQFNALRDQGDENHTTLSEGQDNIKNLLSEIRSLQYQAQDEQRILKSIVGDQANEISQLRDLWEKRQSRSKPHSGTNERSSKRKRTNQELNQAPKQKRARRSNQQGPIGGTEANDGIDLRRSLRIAHVNEGIAKMRGPDRP
ncbi:uncharacterized protein M437DRAFT_70722 [Aureobasidium melanogenum CBS 110374]|uniref:Uncharacterized protein n=1 Tax=Aureobasidium melanogenum (strain CBS 110374) TaxID=1043003 RepID=A0A074VB11_AURM1|nr:uncharacterized protein M437DRAFT_70722 [Aureobasidium melanogenum CBS 110374]KEQ57538.1 hypothetical protein M437DRAFT_70722 [Aureobasidium melanogenum CBS 110374]